MHHPARTVAGLGLAALTLLGLSTARSALAAADIITFDNLTDEPARNNGASFASANGGSSLYDGVTFSSNATVFGDQFTIGTSSPLATSHSGNYSFAAGNTTTTLTTTKTLYGLYLGQINFGTTASSVTVNALAGNTILASKTDTLSSITQSYFDTSSFSTLTGVTGYSLVGSNPNSSNSNDFVGDDFTFTAPIVAAPPITGTFDFESNTQNQHTTFTDTSGVINATFSSTIDSATSPGYTVESIFNPPANSGFSGKQLITAAAQHLPLSVVFDHTLGSGSVGFATLSNGGGTFTATELLNGAAVGTAVGTGNSGILNFSGVSFNALSLSDTGAVFAVDNLNVSSSLSSAPEPSQTAGLAFTALGVGGLLLRARKKKAQVG